MIAEPISAQPPPAPSAFAEAISSGASDAGSPSGSPRLLQRLDDEPAVGHARAAPLEHPLARALNGSSSSGGRRHQSTEGEAELGRVELVALAERAHGAGDVGGQLAGHPLEDRRRLHSEASGAVVVGGEVHQQIAPIRDLVTLALEHADEPDPQLLDRALAKRLVERLVPDRGGQIGRHSVEMLGSA